ncbi:conserved hypothetical protein [Ricinus communis]|uniref:RING-type domain-containing protein n=1 Tax=Ricinus communis TaxID=3988 RepID=B9T6R0_RICCO|nr:conserved hypothetical protein [Ricinus communis]
MTSSGARPLNTAQFLSHVEEQNPAIPYSKRRVEEQETAACAVCLSEFTEGESVRNLECKHLFHNGCLDKWLQQCKSTCPLCRNKVVADEVVARYRQQKDDENGTAFDRSHEEMVVLVSSLRVIWAGQMF